MAKYASQVNIGVTATTGPARKELQAVSADAKRADKELKAAGSEVKTDKAESEFGQLEKQISATAKKLHQLKGELAKGVDASGTVKSLTANINSIRGQVAPEAPSVSKRFLGFEDRLNKITGEQSALKKGTDILVGGGAVAGVALVASAFSSAASSAKELSVAIANGEMTAEQARQQLIRSIPIIGQFSGGIIDFIDVAAGWSAELAKMGKAATDLRVAREAADSIRGLRDQIKGISEDRKLSRQFNQSIADARDRGASEVEIAEIRVGQDIFAERREADRELAKRTKEAEEKADKAAEGLEPGEMTKRIYDELGETLAVIREEWVESIVNAGQDARYELKRAVKNELKDKMVGAFNGIIGDIGQGVAGIADVPAVKSLAGMAATLRGAGEEKIKNDERRAESYANELKNLDRQLAVEMSGNNERDRRNAEINARDDLTDAQKRELIAKNDAIDQQKLYNDEEKKRKDDAQATRANPELMLAGSAAFQRLALVQSGKLVDSQNPMLREAKKTNEHLGQIAANTSPAGAESLN